MSFDASLDINLYSDGLESLEQEAFKNAFLVHNKHKYPREQLWVLVNIFMNIEFENCRYPKPTMEHIENLSKGFVGNLRNSLNLPKISATDSNATGAKDNENAHKKIEYLTPCDRFIPGFVVILFQDQTKYDVIKQSCSFSGMPRPKIIYEPQGSHVRAKLYIQNQLIAFSISYTEITAFEYVVHEALMVLMGMCYIIKVKEHIPSQIKMLDVMNDSTIDASDNTTHQNKISENNAGHKNLKNMGCKEDDGLGKNNQGITSPLETRRAYLREFKIQAQNYIMKFLSGPKKKLSFSTEFTEDERNVIHSICTKVGVWTKSLAKPGNRRQLVIVKKQTSQEIFDELRNCRNFQNDYYQLLTPFEFNNE